MIIDTADPDYAVWYWDIDTILWLYTEYKYSSYGELEKLGIEPPLSKEDAREVLRRMEQFDISLGIQDSDIYHLIEEVLEERNEINN